MNRENIYERYEFREIKKEEAMIAAEIEQICFPPNEACTPERMTKRVELAPELFLVVIEKETGTMVGFLNGLATEEETLRDEFFTDASLHHKNGKNVMILGLDVLPEYRGQGIATVLMKTYLKREKERGRKRIILTCLEGKVSMYEKMGYQNNGISGSNWGAEQWYEMYCEWK